MFVNGLPFLVTFSRNIRLTTIEYLPSRTAYQLTENISKVVKLYARVGFTIRTTLMDMDFEKLVDRIDNIEVNTTAAK